MDIRLEGVEIEGKKWILTWREYTYIHIYIYTYIFFSSEIGVFGGILDVHVMIQAIGVESRCVHLN